MNNKMNSLANECHGTKSIVERTENEMKIVRSDCKIFEELHQALKEEIKKYNNMMIDT